MTPALELTTVARRNRTENNLVIIRSRQMFIICLYYVALQKLRFVLLISNGTCVVRVLNVTQAYEIFIPAQNHYAKYEIKKESLTFSFLQL